MPGQEEGKSGIGEWEQHVRREVVFSRSGVKPPRLEGSNLSTACIEEFLRDYDNCVVSLDRESGEGIGRRPAKLTELVDVAQ